MIKKSLNPFKMIGSYIGALLFGIFIWINNPDMCVILVNCSIPAGIFNLGVFESMKLYLGVVWGFIIGYIIHIFLADKMEKKNDR